MTTYDWIVIGNGLAGAALSYELAKQGLSVLVLEQQPQVDNATHCSYGGIAYWSGKTDLMRQLAQEGLERHLQLSDELDHSTQFRELDLLLTISPETDTELLALSYAECVNPPILLDRGQACEMEPLLNPAAISGAFTVPHGHVRPTAVVEAYNQGFRRLGGQIQFERVIRCIRTGNRVTGVETTNGIVQADRVAIAAGGLSRSLLQQVGITVPVYFTHAEVIKTPPVDVTLQTLVMPALLERFELEKKAGDIAHDAQWDEADAAINSTILDAGVVQFADGDLCMGQISRILTNPHAKIDAAASEAQLRQAIGKVLPALQSLKGTWHHCLVAFSGDGVPLVGSVPGLDGAYLFAGFSNPFAILPAIAPRFVQWTETQTDPLIEQMQPLRFSSTIAL